MYIGIQRVLHEWAIALIDAQGEVVFPSILRTSNALIAFYYIVGLKYSTNRSIPAKYAEEWLSIRTQAHQIMRDENI